MKTIELKAIIYFLEKIQTEEALLAQAQHGDMVVEPQDLRSMNVYFVQALAENGQPCPKKLVQKDRTGSGYCSIPLSITQHFEDPVAYFLESLSIKKTGIRLHDWYEIEVSPQFHQKTLQEQTGGRLVPESRE